MLRNNFAEKSNLCVRRRDLVSIVQFSVRHRAKKHSPPANEFFFMHEGSATADGGQMDVSVSVSHLVSVRYIRLFPTSASDVGPKANLQFGAQKQINERDGETAPL